MVRRKVASSVALALAAFIAPSVDGASTCYAPSWSSENGNLYLNNHRVHLKGVNWYGFDTDINVIQGLWGTHTMADNLSMMKKQGFNAIRVPLSLKMALNKNIMVNAKACNADCVSGKSWDVLTKLFNQAADNGILIMLDMHTFEPNYQVDVWYTADYTEADYHKGWMNLIAEYKGYPNFFAMDLLNEPKGVTNGASWGLGVEATDWNLAAQRLIQAVDEAHPDYNGLFFVEGVQAQTSTAPYTSSDFWWGGNFMGLYKNPISISSALDRRVVYAPHTYGPSTNLQPYFEATNFPTNMPGIWDQQLGYIEQLTGRAAVMGEWGGHYEEAVGSDGVDNNGNGISDSYEWMNAFADYLWENCISDTFFWCWNGDSVGTGGLFSDDFTTLMSDKLALLASVQPHPASFGATEEGGKLCITPGSDANGYCRRYSYGGDTREVRGSRMDPDASFGAPVIQLAVSLSGVADPLSAPQDTLDGAAEAIAAWLTATPAALFLEYANSLVEQDFLAAEGGRRRLLAAVRSKLRLRRNLVTDGVLTLTYEVEDDASGTYKGIADDASTTKDLQAKLRTVSGLESVKVDSVNTGKVKDVGGGDAGTGDDDDGINQDGGKQTLGGGVAGGIGEYKMYIIAGAAGLGGLIVLFCLYKKCSSGDGGSKKKKPAAAAAGKKSAAPKKKGGGYLSDYDTTPAVSRQSSPTHAAAAAAPAAAAPPMRRMEETTSPLFLDAYNQIQMGTYKPNGASAPPARNAYPPASPVGGW